MSRMTAAGMTLTLARLLDGGLPAYTYISSSPTNTVLHFADREAVEAWAARLRADCMQDGERVGGLDRARTTYTATMDGHQVQLVRVTRIGDHIPAVTS